jgi:hypothetical protein
MELASMIILSIQAMDLHDRNLHPDVNAPSIHTYMDTELVCSYRLQYNHTLHTNFEPE